MTSSFASSEATTIIPAELSFLTIYNPSLADNDENLRDQIVFYTSKDTRARGKRNVGNEDEETALREEENEKLRQVGLAQGMVNFARNFSDGKAVDTVETEKSRVILHELEPGWWILASIHLTQLSSSRNSSDGEPKFEYSSREVAPPQLLLRQLTRAHSIFMLHHSATLNDLFSRLGRQKFCSLLERFWSRFIWNWNVLLHGNPAVDIFNGTKLAAGGELGIGVGEEEWGSGEREVLEDFVSRTDGLVDLVVSRFGDAPPPKADAEKESHSAITKVEEPWLGADIDPRPSDGVLFSGVGTLSRQSLTTVSHWMEWIYRYGSNAYGVGENPASAHRRRRKKTPRHSQDFSGRVAVVRGPKSVRRTAIMNNATAPGIPPPLVRTVEKSLQTATAKALDESDAPKLGNQQPQANPVAGPEANTSTSGTDTMMKYLTLGYGSAWSLPTKTFQVRQKDNKETEREPEQNDGDSPEAEHDKPEEKEDTPLSLVDPTPEVSDDESQVFKQRLEESMGKFIIGLTGDLENDIEETDEPKDDSAPREQRILVRIINVETTRELPTIGPWNDRQNGDPEGPGFRHHKLQVAVYVHQPFIFTFLYVLHTPSLSYPSFYRSIHHQLGPLQKPLLNSTDPAKVAQRIEAAMGETHSIASSTTHSIHDLVFDPRKLTVHTSIANIPVPGTLAAEGLIQSSSGSWLTLGIPTGSSTVRPPAGSPSSSLSPWTRVDALNVHMQILNTYIATRSLPHEFERTAKTSRGWWVLWMRIPQSAKQSDENNQPEEAFLVRQSTEAVSRGKERKVSSKGSWLVRDREVSGPSLSGGAGLGSGVSEGIGVDARRWVEGLLALNR